MTTTVNEVVVHSFDDGYIDEESYYGVYDSSVSAINKTHARVRTGTHTLMGDHDMHSRVLQGYFRFQTVAIPQGATIVSAKLNLSFHSTGTGYGKQVVITANDVDDLSLIHI